jgi:hypothetical protein
MGRCGPSVARRSSYLRNLSLVRTRPCGFLYRRAGSQRAGPLRLGIRRLAPPRQIACAKLQGMPQDLRDVEPRELRLPSRRSGPDPYKLQREIARFGASSAGMPPAWVYEASDGSLVVYNGVTRDSRIAKLSPGTMIRAEVVGKLRRAYAGEPKIGDYVP